MHWILFEIVLSILFIRELGYEAMREGALPSIVRMKYSETIWKAKRLLEVPRDWYLYRRRSPSRRVVLSLDGCIFVGERACVCTPGFVSHFFRS